MKNFSSNPKHLKTVLKLIATLSSLISKKAEGTGPVKHYLDNHGGVPLWVLVGYLTIGNISYFYLVLDDSLKELIAKDFSQEYKKSYNQHLQIPKNSIEDVLKSINLFRNVCAHEERLYCFKLNRPPRSRHNSNLLNIPSQNLQGSLFSMVALLKLVLLKKEHKNLLGDLAKLFKQYQQSFPSLQFNQILTVMGFPKKWETYF
jgi:abortive infection bacteriophage resistance protein